MTPLAAIVVACAVLVDELADRLDAAIARRRDALDERPAPRDAGRLGGLLRRSKGNRWGS